MNPQELRQIGRYPVRCFIAEGGMAWVFEVTDPRFNARRALKMLKPAAGAGAEFRRFESEARLLGALDHPNLITLFDFGRDETLGCYYYTMQYVDGPPLSQRGTLTIGEAVPIFLDVLAGLTQLHDRGIVHRDIKPANVLLTSDGRAVLGDLGIARTQEEAGLTRTGTAIGTVLYMAPEQARGVPVTPASDVFAMGLSLYQVLAGKTVYETIGGLDTSGSQSVLLYLGSLIHSGSEFKIQFPKEIPPAIRDVIRKACRFDPKKRYADAREMHNALLEALDARPPSYVPRVAAALALLALLGGGAWRGVVWWEARPAATPAPAPEPAAPLEAAAPAPALRLAGRTPAESQLVAHRGDAEVFEVSAEDPAGGRLRYAWSVDGEAQPASGARFEWRAERAAKVAVRVEGERGGAVDASWEVSLENRRPEAKLLPAGPVALDPGQSKDFRVEAKDADGDPLTTRFLLDGKPVAEGARWRFVAEAPGTHLLRVEVKDPQGGETHVERKLEVRGKGAPAETARAPEPAPAAAPLVASVAPVAPPPRAVPHRDPKEAALAALQEYKAAYEARDVSRLARVWRMNPGQRAATESVFASADSVQVSLDVHKVDVVDADNVSIDFDQELAFSGPRALSKGGASKSTALVIRVGEDRWAISSILPRR